VGGAAGGGGGAETEQPGFLDKSIAGGGGEVGMAPLEAMYNIGDVIHVSFNLSDNDGTPVTDALPSCTVVEVTFRHDDEHYNIIDVFPLESDEETGLYRLEIPTDELAPGIYDLWLGFGDGTAERLRIQLLPAG